MKEAKVTVEYVTHCLASGNRHPDGYDTFEKDSAGRLIWRQSWWYSAMIKALELSSLKSVKPGHFHFNLAVDAPVELYRRRYGKDNFRTHEAIMPGTTVVFELVVANHITESSLSELFGRLGKYVGLTPYGFNLGYGKFNVNNIKIENGA